MNSINTDTSPYNAVVEISLSCSIYYYPATLYNIFFDALFIECDNVQMLL